MAIEPLLPSLQNVGHSTAQRRVVDTLRRAILGGGLSPGTPLVLATLSASLGVSRTPIREAIRELATEGLVDFDSFRSATVHTPTLEEAREIYKLRLLLDPLAVREAVVRIAPQALDRAQALHDAMLATDDVGEWVDANREFHGVLLDAADSPWLIRIIDTLRDAAAIQVALSLRVSPSHIADANADHSQILAAFKKHDADAAAELTERHLRATLEIIEGYERSRAQPSPAR